MKTLGLLGVLGVIAGLALGLYLGVWVMFIGGIMGLASVVSTLVAGGGIVTSLLGWSIVKIVFAGAVGSLSAYAIILPSASLAMASFSR